MAANSAISFRMTVLEATRIESQFPTFGSSQKGLAGLWQLRRKEGAEAGFPYITLLEDIPSPDPSFWVACATRNPPFLSEPYAEFLSQLSSLRAGDEAAPLDGV